MEQLQEQMEQMKLQRLQRQEEQRRERVITRCLGGAAPPLLARPGRCWGWALGLGFGLGLLFIRQRFAWTCPELRSMRLNLTS